MKRPPIKQKSQRGGERDGERRSKKRFLGGHAVYIPWDPIVLCMPQLHSTGSNRYPHIVITPSLLGYGHWQEQIYPPERDGRSMTKKAGEMGMENEVKGGSQPIHTFLQV
jgi:hypothetical protein